jgi:hypothetical protein
MNLALVTVALAALGQEMPEPEMHAGGWTFLGLAWLSVGTLLAWSYIRVLSSPSSESKSDAT